MRWRDTRGTPLPRPICSHGSSSDFDPSVSATTSRTFCSMKRFEPLHLYRKQGDDSSSESSRMSLQRARLSCSTRFRRGAV